MLCHIFLSSVTDCVEGTEINNELNYTTSLHYFIPCYTLHLKRVSLYSTHIFMCYFSVLDPFMKFNSVFAGNYP